MELKKPRTSQQKSQYEIEYDENGEEIPRVSDQFSFLTPIFKQENNDLDQSMEGND